MSYAIAGLSAMFSGLCYSEFGTEYPVAGGSFVFILYTFGEFWSWITATNIIFNYSTLLGPLPISIALPPAAYLTQHAYPCIGSPVSSRSLRHGADHVRFPKIVRCYPPLHARS